MTVMLQQQGGVQWKMHGCAQQPGSALEEDTPSLSLLVFWPVK